MELIFKFLADYFLNLYFSQFWKEELCLREGKDFMYGLSKVFYLQTKHGAQLDSLSHRGASSHWSLLIISRKLMGMVLPLLLPTGAGPGCHTARVKRSSAQQRTDTEQGNAENLLQHGNWGHYSAGSRCKRSPRTQTPTIKTQSQHRRGSSGCSHRFTKDTWQWAGWAGTGTSPVCNHKQHAREDPARPGERHGTRARSDTPRRPSHPHASLTLLPGLRLISHFNSTLLLPIHTMATSILKLVPSVSPSLLVLAVRGEAPTWGASLTSQFGKLIKEERNAYFKTDSSLAQRYMAQETQGE